MPSVAVNGPTMLFVRGSKIEDPNDDLSYRTGEVYFDVLEEPEEPWQREFGSVPLTIVDDGWVQPLPSHGRRPEEGDIDPVVTPSCKYLALAVGSRLPNGSFGNHRYRGLVLRESGDAFEMVGTWNLSLHDDKRQEDRTLKLI